MSKSKDLSDIATKKADIDDAITKKHTQNTDTILDEGGANEVSAETIVGHIADVTDRRFSFVVSRLVDINEQINTGRRLRVRISSTGSAIGDVMTCNVRMGIRATSSNRRAVERTIISEGNSTTIKAYTVGSVDLGSDTLVFTPVTATSFDIIYNVNSTDMISFSMRIDITCSTIADVFTITEIVNEVQP